MSHVPHDLRDEFPHAVDALHQLKLENAHFKSLADKYHDLNRELHRIDTGLEPASEDRTEAMKKQRLSLLDDISAMISQVA